jgi:hypothetical protein
VTTKGTTGALDNNGIFLPSIVTSERTVNEMLTNRSKLTCVMKYTFLIHKRFVIIYICISEYH